MENDGITKEKMDKMDRRDLMTKIILCCVAVIMLVGWMFQGMTSRRQLAEQLKSVTDVKDNFILNDLPIVEQKDKYRKLMIRVFDVYAYKYDGQFQKAMSGKDQADFIDLTFKLDNLLGFKHYQIPTIALMETYFNPKGHNTESGNDERGMFQQWWSTALYAQSLLTMMPDIYQKELKISLKSPDDLYSWEVSTKVAYILCWWHRRDFPVEEWWLSIYHWGDFLALCWDDGKGRIPNEFVINGIHYNVMLYFGSWFKLVECFNRGEVEPGKEIIEKWQAYQKNLMKEEIQLRGARSVIRRLKSQLEEKKYYEKTLTDKYIEIDQTVKDTLDSLQKIYGDASKKNSGEQMRSKLNEAKQVIKTMITNLRDK